MGVESRNGGRKIGRENTRREESRSERGRLRDSKFSDRQDLRDRYTFSLPNKLVPPPLLFSNYGVRSIIALFSTSLFFWGQARLSLRLRHSPSSLWYSIDWHWHWQVDQHDGDWCPCTTQTGWKCSLSHQSDLRLRAQGARLWTRTVPL